MTDSTVKRNFRKILPKAKPFFLAICLQTFLVLLTVYIVVLAPTQKEKPKFRAVKTVNLHQRDLDHRIDVAEFQQVAGAPKMLEKITTASLLSNSIPGMPQIPDMKMDPIDLISPLFDPVSMLQKSDLISGLQGVTAENSEVTLFGIKDNAERIIIMIDDGGSVLNKAKASGVSITKLKDESIRLVNKLNPNTLFGFIHFVRRVGTFRDYLVPANKVNKAEVSNWIKKNFGKQTKRTDIKFANNGIQAAFELAFQLEPNVIFLFSDADFQRNKTGKRSGGQVPWSDLADTLKNLQSQMKKNVRIHFIGFQVESEHKYEFQKIIKRYRGKFRVL